MVNKIRPFIPLIILCSFTVYLLFTVLLSDIVLLRQHYVGLILLGTASASFIFKYPTGHLTTALMLFIGTFGKASFTPTVQTIGIKFIFSLDFSWHYLFLLVLYIVVNHKDLPTWLKIAFADNNPNQENQ